MPVLSASTWFERRCCVTTGIAGSASVGSRCAAEHAGCAWSSRFSSSRGACRPFPSVECRAAGGGAGEEALGFRCRGWRPGSPVGHRPVEGPPHVRAGSSAPRPGLPQPSRGCPRKTCRRTRQERRRRRRKRSPSSPGHRPPALRPLARRDRRRRERGGRGGEPPRHPRQRPGAARDPARTAGPHDPQPLRCSNSARPRVRRKRARRAIRQSPRSRESWRCPNRRRSGPRPPYRGRGSA